MSNAAGTRCPTLGFMALLSLCVAWVALLNGYPLLFNDSGQYLTTAVVRFYSPFDRPPIYGWFLYLTTLNISPWFAIFAQSLIVVLVVDLFRRSLFTTLPDRATHVAVAALATSSMLPFFVAQIMPDYFSGMLPLAVVLLVLRFEPLTWMARLGLGGVIFFGVGAHTSHIPSVVGCLLVAVIWKCLILERRTIGGGLRARLRCAVGAAVASLFVILALLALVVLNNATYGRFTISPGSHVFLMGRLLADGTAADYVKRHCPQAGFKICDHLDEIPSDANEYIWDGPLLKKLGNWAGSRRESEAIIAGTLQEDAVRVARNALIAGIRQFFHVGIEDVVSAVPPEHSLHAAVKRLYPQDAEEFAESLQQRGSLVSRPFRILALVHNAIYWCALAALLWVLVRTHREDREFAGAALVCVAFLIANAFVCGALSGVFERYQGRTSWVVILLMTFWILRRLRAAGAGNQTG